jgi:hypothetical protein
MTVALFSDIDLLKSLSSGRREGLLLWRRLFAQPLHCIGLATAMAIRCGPTGFALRIANG